MNETLLLCWLNGREVDECQLDSEKKKEMIKSSF